MSAIKNAAPFAILEGVQDVSGRPPVIEPEQIPSHLPHVYTFAERGSLVPQLVIGDSATRMFGAQTFAFRSPYANHQTPLLDILNGAANQYMLQRVLPDDAGRPASLRLWLDVLAAPIAQFERNPDGSFRVGSDGQKIPSGSPVAGHRVRWILESISEEIEEGADAPSDDLKQARPKVGTMEDAQGEPSTMYPIHEFRVTDAGAYGNLIGIRLSAPTLNSAVPINDTAVLDQAAYLYRLACVERPDANTTPNTLETLSGELYVDFSYKEGAIDSVADTELFADDVILQGWSAPAENGSTPVFGPFGEQHVYVNYIEQLLADFQAAEAPFGLITDKESDLHLFNFIGGTDLTGVPYYSYSIEGPQLGGLLMTESSTHYAAGGTSGTMNAATFDAAVANQVANYGDLPGIDVLDDAVYPVSVIYDTGFTLETKKKLLVPIGRRKDLWVVLSTQDVAQPQNTPSEESSIAVALRTAARMYPESEVHGTPVCRALVIGHSGFLVNSKWKKLAPLTLDFANKCARYMGAGNGIWKPGFGFDMPPNNQITLFRGVNATFKKAGVRSSDWASGLVWVQSYDRRSLFCPAYQTVYDDDTSILNAAPNMFVAVELEKVAQRAWRDLTGISKLTKEQFIERSNRLIAERVAGRFDDRVVITVQTYYTQADTQRGYSWSCIINLYGNNMKTIGRFTVVARRREDLVP